MQDKPTSQGILQLASGGPKQLHLTKPELGRLSDSRKTDWLAVSHSFCPPSAQAPPSAPPTGPTNDPAPWRSRPAPTCRGEAGGGVGAEEAWLCRRRRGRAARPDYSCDTHGERRWWRAARGSGRAPPSLAPELGAGLCLDRRSCDAASPGAASGAEFRRCYWRSGAILPAPGKRH